MFDRLLGGDEGSKYTLVDVRALKNGLPISQYLHKHKKQTHAIALFNTLILLAIGAPFMLHIIGKEKLKSLQRTRSKAKVPFFWAVACKSCSYSQHVYAHQIDDCSMC